MPVADPSHDEPRVTRAGWRQVDWRSVAVYYVIACAVSWPFFWWRDIHRESWIAWGFPGAFKHATYMWGPGIAALIVFWWFRKTHRRQITLLGTSPLRSLAFFLVPMAGLLMAYAPEVVQTGAALQLVFQLVVVGFLVTLGEELGWRGFLQDALRPLPRFQRYVLIGILWELWHFTNRMHVGPWQVAVLRVLIFIVILIGLSWILGEATTRSASIVVAVTLHAWVNLIAEASVIFGASPWRAVMIGVLSLGLWAYLLRTWPVNQAPQLAMGPELRQADFDRAGPAP